MSAATSMAREVAGTSRRACPRQSLTVPLDVIILRSGIPDSLPGRCTDLSEVGLGAVIAGEMSTGDHLALEFKLPDVAVPVRARALVRHHHQFRYGLQFVGLAAEQREMIRYWALHSAPTPANPIPDTVVELPGLNQAAQAAPSEQIPSRRNQPRRAPFDWRWAYPLLLVLLALGTTAWWRWQRGWHELEASAKVVADSLQEAPLKVAPEAMEKQILQKVDPEYPEVARRAGTQGVVTLDAVIGPDGAVQRLQALSGPDLLTQPALDAVQSWKFQPYRVDGKAVAVQTTIAVSFQLN